MKNLFKAVFLTAALITGTANADQGVTDTQVLIGSNQDMSGPFAAFGAPAMEAAQMYFDEVNAAGGVHGRQIKMIVEDHGYQMPKAMSNLNKLVNSDKILAMLLQLGTPMNIASFPLLEAKKIANVSPLTAARQMIEPPSAYKYAGTSSYYDQMRTSVPYLSETTGVKNICSMYIPSDFGLEIAEGTKDAVAEAGSGLTFGGRW